MDLARYPLVACPGVCLGIVILALVLAGLGIMTSAAALLGVGYVLFLTWCYTKGARNRP
jgi:hypothetical protein